MSDILEAMRRTMAHMDREMRNPTPLDYREVVTPTRWRYDVERLGAEKAAKYFIESQPIPTCGEPVFIQEPDQQ